ncbi:hypothetical protein MNEG_0990 [Monoraphidium neglectum]|uniref:CARDB domain-containing protein n=1 Tax=Monoraphidium neglectum TaxID=145388 RepID=A0A0D2NRN8_9CHLO|nr:hypothetical protein MNEG_0990 [Monoraphidium neglectum]KIZ06961.1 hypothetical protein MNEG_0990 [Monoraphidium neglectum]|eukprot:XP_013905980.1 hypothetical protein MNEG_0990 [Monoraphidium neglectum]
MAADGKRAGGVQAAAICAALVMLLTLLAPAAAQSCYAGNLSTPSTNFDLQYSSKVLNTTLSYIKKPKTLYNRFCFNVTAASPCNSTALCCKNSAITRLSTVSIAIVPTCIVKGLTSNFSLSFADGTNAKSAFGFKINKASRKVVANVRIAPKTSTSKALGSTVVCINLPAAAGLCNTVGSLCGGTTCKVNVTTSKFKPASLTKPKSLPCCLTGNVNIQQALQTDFAVTAIQLTPTSPVTGQPFTARVTVTNTGEIAANPGSLGVWADKAALAACGEAADQTNATVGSIAAGASVTVSFTFTAGAVGNKTFRAYSDPACAIPEKSDTNDQLALSYTVVSAVTSNVNLVASALAITGYAGPPATLLPGQTATVRFVVTNAGTSASPATTYALWVNKASVAVCNDAGPSTIAAVPALAAGAATTLTAIVALPGTSGAYTLQLIVDYPCSVAESSEADNTASYAYQLAVPAGPLPDLTITNVLTNPGLTGLLPVGQLLNLTFTVVNQGTAASLPGLYSIINNLLGLPLCGALGTVSGALGALAPGASQTVNVPALPLASIPGLNTLSIVADSNCSSIEANKTNNVVALPYNISNPGGLLPNLGITNILATPSLAGLLPLGQLVNLTFDVVNTGTAASVATVYTIFDDLLGLPVCGVAGTVTGALGPIAAGATQTVNVPNFPLAGLVGAKTLGIVADASCTNSANGSSNSFAALPYNLSSVTGLVPNLGVTNILASPSLAGLLPLGQLVNLTFDVVNTGTAASVPTLYTIFSDLLGLPVCGVAGAVTGTLGPIAAGATQTVSVLNFPLAGVIGAKTLKIVADLNCTNSANGSSNSFAALPYNLTGLLPNLGITNILASPSLTGLLPLGQLVNLTFDVVNSGTAASAAGLYTIFDDLLGLPLCGAVGAVTGVLGPIAAGATQTINVLNFPLISAIGAKTLKIVADLNCTNSANGSSANTFAALPYNISGVDFVLNSLSLVPNTFPLGLLSQFSINMTITNIGNIAGDPGVVGALSGVLSPLLCGNPLLSGGGLLGSFAWTLGAIPPGATVTALFPGFLSTGLLGVPVNIWVVVNNLCAVLEPNFVNNQKLLTYTI